MRFLIRAVALLLVILISTNLYAEGLKLKLEDLKLEAIQLSPDLAAQESQLESILAEIREENLPLNPKLQGHMSFAHHYPDERGDNEFEIELSQTLRMGDFGKRYVVSKLMRKQKTIEGRLKLMKSMQEISLLYYRLWALQEEEVHLKELRERSDKLVEMIQSLSEQGRIEEKDKSIALSAAAQISAQQEGIKFEILSTTNSLSKKIGKDVRGIKTSKPYLPKLPSLKAVKDEADRSENGVLERTKLMLKLATEQERLAKRETFPHLTPKLSYAHDDEGKDYIGVGLSFNLPIFQTNKAERVKARGAKREAKKIQEYLRSGGFDAGLESAYLRIKSKQKQAKIFDDRVVPELAKASKIALEQYENGQISFLELWQIEKERHESIDESLSLWVEAYASLSDLQLLIGNEIEEAL